MKCVAGRVMGRLPKELFRVQIETGQEVVAHVSAGQRIRMSRLLEGDQVHLEISRTDRSRGRIIDWNQGRSK